MGTHCNIGYRTEDNGIFGTYCHFDGYFRGAGAELQLYLESNGAEYLRARIYQAAMQNGFSSFAAGGGETYFEKRSESGKCIITDMYAFIHDHQFAYILELDGSLSAYSDGMKQESWCPGSSRPSNPT